MLIGWNTIWKTVFWCFHLVAWGCVFYVNNMVYQYEFVEMISFVFAYCIFRAQSPHLLRPFPFRSPHFTALSSIESKPSILCRSSESWQTIFIFGEGKWEKIQKRFEWADRRKLRSSQLLTIGAQAQKNTSIYRARIIMVVAHLITSTWILWICMNNSFGVNQVNAHH